MIDPQFAALSSPSAVAAQHDDYLIEAVALAARINQRLAERTPSQPQGLVADGLGPPPAVGPAA
jgi:hypothetical protein